MFSNILVKPSEYVKETLIERDLTQSLLQVVAYIKKNEGKWSTALDYWNWKNIMECILAPQGSTSKKKSLERLKYINTEDKKDYKYDYNFR